MVLLMNHVFDYHDRQTDMYVSDTRAHGRIGHRRAYAGASVRNLFSGFIANAFNRIEMETTIFLCT